MSILDNLGELGKREPDQEFECDDELFATEYPGLYEWLARIRHQGKMRVGASLTIKYRDGGVSLCLSAPSEGRVGWHQAKTVSEALEGLERRLQASTVDWRKRTSK